MYSEIFLSLEDVLRVLGMLRVIDSSSSVISNEILGFADAIPGAN